MSVPHVLTHWTMLGAACRCQDVGEIVGQVLRLVVAGLGSLTGRYPVGNTVGADVSARLPTSVPDDLRALLGEATTIKEES